MKYYLRLLNNMEDPERSNKIWNYFMTLENEEKVITLINDVFDAGEKELAEEMQEEAHAYFDWALSSEEKRLIDIAENWERSSSFSLDKTAIRKRGQKYIPKPRSEKRIQQILSGTTGKEITQGLNAIESRQEKVFSNLFQGGNIVKTTFNPIKRAKMQEEQVQRNYLKQLERVRREIIEGDYLIRKMSAAEKEAYRRGALKEDIFPQGIEGMKAFAIDKTYTFSDAERNANGDDYQHLIKINLTPKLKTFLINYLSPNVGNPLGVTDRRLHFNRNPQFKFEQEGFTILIPSASWKQFWSFVTGYFQK
ncbi:hypothetical protein [Chryseobacterium sp. JUb7]|uniref:hypothetical protein n=1 Tax=Chryseobacterium sp. JUb7 TaxID=2940599 RepID=UPI002168D61B|nr:hypothetical protein [Chryseobacterium sp. JUb7]MCS3528665.1 hypothetical protein [Chryseobacterium sp. JUb7]